MMTKVALSRADLLWSFAAVVQDQQEAVAELLGFEKNDIEPVIAAQNTISISGALPKIEGNFKFSPELQGDRPPVISRPTYYRIIERKHETELDEELDPRPEWFQKAEANYFTKTTLSIPAIHRSKPQYQPLVAWARLWPFLYRVLGSENNGSKADVGKLVQQVAAGKVVRQVPRLPHQSWSESATILIDINDKNFPYRNDFFYLCAQLKKLRGEQGLDIQYLNDAPGGYVLRYQQQQETISPWHMPDVNNPLLILSDLGMHAKSRAALYDWLVFGQQLQLHGCRPVVLMPVAARDLDARLLQYFDCVVWDNTSQLKSIVTTRLAEQTEQQLQKQQQQLNNLLTYFSPAVRVDAGLVRAIRQLLPADQYDIGHESALWQHAAVQHVHEQWGWQAAARIEFLAKFSQLVVDLPPAAQVKLVTLLAQYHAQLPEELYFEMMVVFLQTDSLWQLIPVEVQQATKVFMANLVKTYDQNPEHQGLALFVQRYLARHDVAQCRQVNQYTEAFYIVDKTRHNPITDWPEDIAAKQIQAFSNVKQAATRYLLIQQGQHLQLISQNLYQQQHGSDWSNTGVVLAQLSLTDTVIYYQHECSDGAAQERHLNLSVEQAIDFGVLDGIQTLQIGPHRFTIAATVPLEALPWAVSWAMDTETGSHVESKDQESNVYRWYWHPPELHKEAGVLRGVWYFEKPTQITTPDWATSSDRDQYGIYTDIKVKDMLLRMRWIEPGTFLMGSPETEAERYDDEDQHQVTLTQGYWLADSTVTQALWRAVMGNNPSRFKGDNLPVEQVSWKDAEKFIIKLNKLQPLLNLCLPSEAQWEYACRAGTVTPFYFGENISPEQVNFDGTRSYAKGKKGEYRQQTVPVKSLAANSWGLYEMHGNAWEWCQDRWQSHLTESTLDPLVVDSRDNRIVRGGSWYDDGRNVRSAVRGSDSPAVRSSLTGFRLARGHQAQLDKKSKSIPANSLDRRVLEQRQSKLLAGIGKLWGSK